MGRRADFGLRDVSQCSPQGDRESVHFTPLLISAFFYHPCNLQRGAWEVRSANLPKWLVKMRGKADILGYGVTW